MNIVEMNMYKNFNRWWFSFDVKMVNWWKSIRIYGGRDKNIH